ncbi:MAG: gluconolaconase [Vicinamibacterales bacterium]
MSVVPTIASIAPSLALPGGRVSLEGGPFSVGGLSLPLVRVGGHPALVSFAAPSRMTFVVPSDVAEGRISVRLDEAPEVSAVLDVGVRIASGIHQVDSPAVDAQGRVYLTCSGSRGQETSVSVYRVTETGRREVFVTGITNATSLAIGPDGRLYVSSRFDGTVARIDVDGHADVIASDLGVACGLAFGTDGTMFVGDRSGCVFRVERGGEARVLASLPPSVAAYHLAAAPGGDLFVTGPTLSSRDCVYRIDRDGQVSVFATGFGRPQGVATGPNGRLYVVEALAGACGVFRVDEDGGGASPVLAAPSLVGLAFTPDGGLVVASNDSAWRFTDQQFAVA